LSGSKQYQTASPLDATVYCRIGLVGDALLLLLLCATKYCHWMTVKCIQSLF